MIAPLVSKQLTPMAELRSAELHNRSHSTSSAELYQLPVVRKGKSGSGHLWAGFDQTVEQSSRLGEWR